MTAWDLCPICDLMATPDGGPCRGCRWRSAIGEVVEHATDSGAWDVRTDGYLVMVHNPLLEAVADILTEHALQRRQLLSELEALHREQGQAEARRELAEAKQGELL